MAQQIEQIYSDFKHAFTGEQRPMIIRSPGRINIIGEHTDYNDGFVLPAAITKAAYLAIAPRQDTSINVFASDLKEHYSTDITKLEPALAAGWPNYIIGVTAQFLKEGVSMKGFDALLTSDIPIGAGLSSSAAIGCATVFALDQMLNTRFNKMKMIQMAQQAEHEYAGVFCGIMDQFASMMGKKDHAIKLDCRSLAFEYVPLKLEGFKLLLLNTNVKHNLASTQYNTRRDECSKAIEWIRASGTDIHSLRDVSEDMLDKYVLPKDKTIDNRARFVVQENQRLLDASEDLGAGDLAALGQKMFATHEGLSKMYDVSCPELDWLVDFVRDHKGVVGARMMGGGFGGCTINLVNEAYISDIIRDIQPAYHEFFGRELSYYIVETDDGTSLVSTPE